MRTDRRTADVTKLIVGFCKFEKTLRNSAEKFSFSRVDVLWQTAALGSDLCITYELDACKHYESSLICA